jgi:hypothetical protein
VASVSWGSIAVVYSWLLSQNLAQLLYYKLIWEKMCDVFTLEPLCYFCTCRFRYNDCCRHITIKWLLLLFCYFIIIIIIIIIIIVNITISIIFIVIWRGNELSGNMEGGTFLNELRGVIGIVFCGITIRPNNTPGWVRSNETIILRWISRKQ